MASWSSPHRRAGAAAVVVDRHAELLAHRPERLVVLGVVQRRAARSPGARRAAARRRSARRPCAQRISSTAASTSCSRICAMPARRPGAAAQKSASQRLCACRPAQRSSRSPASAAGGWCTSDAFGKNGGIVFGKMTSATMPSASSSRRRRSSPSCARRRSPWRSSYGFSNGAGPRVELVVVPRRQVGPVVVDARRRRGSRRR